MPKVAVVLVDVMARGHRYWIARWHDPVTGKRRAKCLGRCDRYSESQARKLMARLEIKFDDDPMARSLDRAPTLEEWIAVYLQRLEAKGRKPATLVGYNIVARLLKAHFGGERRINTIVKMDIERFRIRLTKGELAHVFKIPNRKKCGLVSVAKYMRYTSAIFCAAHDDELIPRNPARKLGLGPPPSSPWHKVSANEFWRLYDVAEGGVKTLLALCRLAGLRRGDALALKWSNVNFDDGVLVFRPIKVERFDKQDARVPISAELRQILEAVRKTSLRIDGHVVAQEDVLDSFGRRTFPQLCAKAGIAPWTKPLHTLRKSCIDDWCKAAPPNVVMEWSTHSALATTLKYYSKVSAADEQIGQRSFLKRPAVPASDIVPATVAS